MATVRDAVFRNGIIMTLLLVALSLFAGFGFGFIVGFIIEWIKDVFKQENSNNKRAN